MTVIYTYYKQNEMEKGTNNNNPRLSPSLLDLKTKIQHSFVNNIDKDHDENGKQLRIIN